MLPIIDFRNGRYQGEIRNHLPNGLGVFFSSQLTYVIGHWANGAIWGKAIIIYSDATIFCGSIREGRAEGVCYYELQREKIKVYFRGGETNRRLAITIPNFNSILQVDSSTLSIISETPMKKGDIYSNYDSIWRIIGKGTDSSQIQTEKQRQNEYEGFIDYFQENFEIPYPDIFEKLVINATGGVDYWMGFRMSGLGVKVRPLPLEESGGRSYRISEMGVMTNDNVLFGIGMRSSSTVLGRVHIEEGVFGLPQTIQSYRLSEGPNDNTRPTKCLATFANFLKRSMTYHDAYLFLNEITGFKQQINRIHELTFTEMKIKNAHEIIETPLSSSDVLQEIQKKRRKKQQESEVYMRQKKKNNRQPSIYNSEQTHPASSSYNLTTLREELYRTIEKKKLSQSKINLDSRSPVKEEDPPQTPKLNHSPERAKPSPNKAKQSPTKNRPNERRLNGSITPPRSRKNSGEKRVGVVVSRLRENLKESPVKYPRTRDVVPEIQEVKEEKRVPAPILKKNSNDDLSPNKRKVNYRDKQLEEWEKAQLKFGRLNGSPKKPGSKVSPTKVRASPSKTYSRPLLTENIFQP